LALANPRGEPLIGTLKVQSVSAQELRYQVTLADVTQADRALNTMQGRIRGAYSAVLRAIYLVICKSRVLLRSRVVLRPGLPREPRLDISTANHSVQVDLREFSEAVRNPC